MMLGGSDGRGWECFFTVSFWLTPKKKAFLGEVTKKQEKNMLRRHKRNENWTF